MPKVIKSYFIILVKFQAFVINRLSEGIRVDYFKLRTLFHHFNSEKALTLCDFEFNKEEKAGGGGTINQLIWVYSLDK